MSDSPERIARDVVAVLAIARRRSMTPSPRMLAQLDAAIPHAFHLRHPRHAPTWDRLGPAARRVVFAWAITTYGARIPNATHAETRRIGRGAA